MLSVQISGEKVEAKPISSDHHSALMPVCAPGRNFLCLRHIIESFGINSYVGQIARRLAFCASPEGFCLEMEACSYDFLELKKRGELDETAVRRPYNIFGLGISENAETLQDWETWAPQSIWKRAELGVGTCSNHAEGFHRSLNEAVSGDYKPSSNASTGDMNTPSSSRQENSQTFEKPARVSGHRDPASMQRHSLRLGELLQVVVSLYPYSGFNHPRPLL
jgi:hypothetical protein